MSNQRTYQYKPCANPRLLHMERLDLQEIALALLADRKLRTNEQRVSEYPSFEGQPEIHFTGKDGHPRTVRLVLEIYAHDCEGCAEPGPYRAE